MTAEARRIMGLETEYGVQHWNPSARPLSAEEFVKGFVQKGGQ